MKKTNNTHSHTQSHIHRFCLVFFKKAKNEKKNNGQQPTNPKTEIYREKPTHTVNAQRAFAKTMGHVFVETKQPSIRTKKKKN